MSTDLIKEDKSVYITEFKELEKELDIFDFANTSNEYLCKREYECKCIDISKKIDITKFKLEDICGEINKFLTINDQANKNKAFTILFIFATKYRRNKKLGSFDLVSKYRSYFSDIPMFEFCYQLAKYSEVNDSNTIKKIISETKVLLGKEEFKNEVEIKNFYCELIATYYERELEAKSDFESKTILKEALNIINGVIYTDVGKNYDKFYATRGRLLVLLGRYDEGEYEIRRALSMVNVNDAENTSRTILYESYLIQGTSIRQFDLHNEKYKELEKIKVNNFKIIALMTTLLGFLLGSINIFSSVNNPFLMGMLLIAFCGLLLILCGTILFGLGLMFKDNKKKYKLYDLIVLVSGVIILAISLICLSVIK